MLTKVVSRPSHKAHRPLAEAKTISVGDLAEALSGDAASIRKLSTSMGSLSEKTGYNPGFESDVPDDVEDGLLLLSATESDADVFTETTKSAPSIELQRRGSFTQKATFPKDFLLCLGEVFELCDSESRLLPQQTTKEFKTILGLLKKVLNTSSAKTAQRSLQTLANKVQIYPGLSTDTDYLTLSSEHFQEQHQFKTALQSKLSAQSLSRQNRSEQIVVNTLSQLLKFQTAFAALVQAKSILFVQEASLSGSHDMDTLRFLLTLQGLPQALIEQACPQGTRAYVQSAIRLTATSQERLDNLFETATIEDVPTLVELCSNNALTETEKKDTLFKLGVAANKSSDPAKKESYRQHAQSAAS